MDAELVKAREDVFQKISSGLRLNWKSPEVVSLDEAYAPGSDIARNGSRLAVEPDLRSNTYLYTPGIATPNSGQLTIHEEVFYSMFPKGRVPDLEFLSNARPEKPTPQNDPLWGIINTPNLSSVLTVVDHMLPKRVLVIGTGVGADVALIAQAMPAGSELIGVDPGPEASTVFGVNTMNKTYQGYGAENLGRYVREAAEKGLINTPETASVKLIQEDSVTWFDKLDAKTNFGTLHPKFDLILIDGNHGFRASEVDVFNAVRYLAPGGTMCIDDWNKAANSSNVMFAGLTLAYKYGWNLYNLEHFQSPTLGKANVVWLINEPWAKQYKLTPEQSDTVDTALKYLDLHAHGAIGD